MSDKKKYFDELFSANHSVLSCVDSTTRKELYDRAQHLLLNSEVTAEGAMRWVRKLIRAENPPT